MMSLWLQVVRKLAYEPRLNSTNLKHVQSDRLILPSRFFFGKHNLSIKKHP